MQTWALCPAGKTTNAFSSGDITQLLATFVDSIGEPDFGTHVVKQLHDIAGIDFLSVYQLIPDEVPRMFISGSRRGRDVSTDCFSRYARGLYREDKTFSAARGMTGGGHTAMTLWNEAEIPSPHRDEIYRRHGIGERLSIVCGDAGAALLAVNLYRYEKSGCYRSRDVETVQSVGQGLLACVRKHIHMLGNRHSYHVADTSAARLQQRFPSLTGRELDVCERILRGWSYDGIAADLGLSTASIKTYRNRAFDRLGIHFRNELFALAAASG